jgi:hypothetical protein
VSSYDALGSMGAAPLGALIAGPIAAAVGVSATQFAAVVLIIVVSALCLIPRDIRTIRSGDVVLTEPGDAGLPEPLPAISSG